MTLASLGLSGNAAVITQHISMPEESPTISTVEEDGDKFTVVEWAGLDRESESGRFAVPVTTMTLRVPTYSKDFTVSVSNVSWGTPVSFDIPLAVVSEKTTSVPMALTAEPKTQFDKAGRFPVLSAEIVNEYFLNWTEHYVMVKIDCIFPVDSRSIVPLQSADLHVEYQECSPEEMNFDIPSVGISAGQNAVAKTASSGTGVPLDRYIIITTDDLAEGCRKLAGWKAQKGLDVRIYTIEQILSNKNYQVGVNGIVDDADALRRYLKTLCNPSVDNYCLFIGSSEKLPLRYFYQYAPKSRTNPQQDNIKFDNFIPSDNYYSDLVTNWELEDDPAGVYAISIAGMTYSPCLYTGRLVCNHQQEIDNYLYKLIHYESFPGKGDDDYLDKALLVQQQRFVGKENLPKKIKSLHQEYYLYYLADNGGMNYNESTPRGCDVINLMRKVGLISLQGHGTPGSIACAGYDKINGKENRHNWRYVKVAEEYNAKEIGFGNYGTKEEPYSGLDLIDDRDKPSVLYSIACDAMPFEKDYGNYRLPYNMGTQFTVAGLSGGVAMLGNTREGYIGASEPLEEQFANEVIPESHIGKAEALSKAKSNVYTYVRATHQLMGDPEFCMWKTKPAVQSVKLTVTDLDIQAEGSTLPNSTIAIFDGVNPPAKFLPKSTACTASLSGINMDNTFFSTSVWKAGMLPYISLCAQRAQLRNTSRSFIVHDASLGATVNPARTFGECVVAQNAVLNVTAIKTLNITEGFIVADNGEANFRCINDVSISGGHIQDVGKFYLNGDDVVISGNFMVTQGAELQINNSTDIINPFAYDTK